MERPRGWAVAFLEANERWLFLPTLLILAACVYYANVPGGASELLLSQSDGQEIFSDFVHQYYPTARNLAQGKLEPAYGYFYSLTFAMVLSETVGRMPLEQAMGCWSAFQVLSALLLLLPLAEFWRRSPWLGCFYLGLVLFSQPLLHNLKWGQVSVFVTGCVLCSWMCYQRGWRKTAVVLLFVPTVMKYYTGLFLLYFVLQRDWRFVGAVVTLTAALLALPLAVYGVAGNVEFYRAVAAKMKHAQGEWIVPGVDAQFFASVLGRLMAGERITALRPELVMLGSAVFLANLALLFRAFRAPLLSEELKLALLFLSLPLLLATSWPHYFVFLPFCQAETAYRLVEQPGRKANAVAWFALAASCLLPSIFCFRLFPSFLAYNFSGTLLWADLLGLAVVYYLAWSGTGKLVVANEPAEILTAESAGDAEER